MTQLTIKCVIREISTFYSVRARMCMCGSGSSILLAFVHTRAKLAWVREISFHALSLNFISPCWQLCNTHRLHYTAELSMGTAGVNTAVLSVRVTASEGVSASGEISTGAAPCWTVVSVLPVLNFGLGRRHHRKYLYVPLGHKSSDINTLGSGHMQLRWKELCESDCLHSSTVSVDSRCRLIVTSFSFGSNRATKTFANRLTALMGRFLALPMTATFLGLLTVGCYWDGCWGARCLATLFGLVTAVILLACTVCHSGPELSSTTRVRQSATDVVTAFTARA